MSESLYSEQLRLFNEQLRKSPRRAYNMFGLSLLYSLEAGEVAREKHRLGINPTSAYDFYNLGVLANLAERHEDAAKLYETAVEVGGDFPELYCNMGLTYEKLSKVSKAVDAFQKYADLAKKDESEESKAEIREVKAHIRQLKG
ncbi:MAG: tetratricopeptide repeat protein [Candidatus Omnitrophica bacterium]|nr:tetratricopeptide repeat protein [Candidatus Omnitrophota bacterium]